MKRIHATYMPEQFAADCISVGTLRIVAPLVSF
jgi:hypothetical protein